MQLLRQQLKQRLVGGSLDRRSSDFDAEFGAKGFTDTAYARMGARATGFLQTSLKNRAPYRSTTEEDVELFRKWCGKGYPELLEL